MKIGIDVQTTLGQKTGFGFYVQNLTEALKKIDKKNKYIMLKPSEEKDLSAPQRFYWDQFIAPRLAKKSHLDIFHQPCFSVPIFHDKMKIVVTIHDLIAIRFGTDIPFFSRQYFGKWMPFSYHWADKIICDSEHTKKDIIDFLKIPESKIKVIYLAADKDLKSNVSQSEIEGVKEKYGIKGKYLLNLSTISPRKNNQFLIDVFYNVLKKYKDYKLVITGKKGWYYEGLFKQVEDLGIKDSVIFTGYIRDEDKSALYAGATIFLFPSLYEGFGFTPLEAMTCGVPVICSNTSSLPEVVGDGGILLSPTDEKGWIKETEILLGDANLRKELSVKGYNQSKKFSWDKCAKETLKVYEELYNAK